MLGYARILNTTRGDLYENPLKAGELVRLRSGGPVMVVSEIGQHEGTVRTCWHDKNGMIQSLDFPPELLMRAGRSFFGRRR